jgi:hypothetical protein
VQQKFVLALSASPDVPLEDLTMNISFFFYLENHYHPVGMVSFFFQLMERSIRHLQHSTAVI